MKAPQKMPKKAKKIEVQAYFPRSRTASSEKASVAGEAGDFTKAMTLAGTPS